MSCDPHRDELILLLEGDVAGEDEETLRAHVQACTSCQDELIRLTLALTALTESVLASASTPSQPAGEAKSRAPNVPGVGRYRRSARAVALAEAIPRLEAEFLSEDTPSHLMGYELLAELGFSGVGRLYRARSSEGAEVALKVRQVTSPASLARRRRFFEQVQTALNLADEPRLVGPLKGGRVEEGDLSLWVEIFPLLEGPSLEDLMEEGRCDPAEATEIAVEIARALRGAHSAGLLLADLTPRDVFLEAEGVRVLVSEPPFEESDNRLTASGAVIGTPYYLSPEQAKGQPCEERSDLFALGAIYHELLTGAPPNKDAETVHELFMARIEGRLSEPTEPELNPAHKQVLARLLAADPERRYQDAEEALGDLLLVREELPLERQDPSWDQVVRLHPPRSKVSAITLVGMVVALAALIALAFFFFS